MTEKQPNRLGDWGNLLVEQLGVVSEALFKKGGPSSPARAEHVEHHSADQTIPPLSAEKWVTLMDEDGHFSETNAKEVMYYAFYGGFSEDIRMEAWKFLLGLYPLNSTLTERGVIMRNKVADYQTLKHQWKTMLPEQLKRCTKFCERQIQIEKDIVRTDRDYCFYKDEQFLDVLHDILVTFVIYNQDLGYAQGMNDLCALILNVLQGDEVSTFWCFANLMERLGSHFNKDQVGMTTTLRALARVLGVVDPELYKHLESVDALNMFFCFRWMLCFFKREFSFDSTKRVWEALLSDYLSPHYELFFACAMIEDSRDVILGKHLQLDEIMLTMNQLAGSRKTNPLLHRSEELFRVFMEKADTEIRDYVTKGLDKLSDAVVMDDEALVAASRPRSASSTEPRKHQPLSPVSPRVPIFVTKPKE